jgi:hypothetical protein
MWETLINILSLATACYTLYPDETTAAVFWIPEQVARLHEQFPHLWIHLIVFLHWVPLLAILPEARETREATIWITNRVTRLKEYLAATFQDDTTEAERQWSPYIGATMLGFLLGIFSVLEQWVCVLVFCMLSVGAVFCAFPRSWRVWTYETVHDYVAYPLMRVGLVSPISEDETLSKDKVDEIVWEDMEDTDEESTGSEASCLEDVEDADDMDDWDDSWSLDLDTPFETENSQSDGTSDSTGSTSTSSAKSGTAGAREMTDASSKPEDAASYLDSFVLLPSAQDQQERLPIPQLRPECYMINDPTAESPEPKNKTTQLPELYIQTREQILKSVIRDNPVAYKDMLESRPADPSSDPSILTSWVALKPEHQPTDMIVLQIEIRKGINFQEKIIVRMHKTTPFVQLKDKLRKKDDKDSELVVGDPRGCYPVFDHETTLSVSFALACRLSWLKKFNADVLFFDATGWFAALGHFDLGTYAGYAEITGYKWKESSGERGLSLNGMGRAAMNAEASVCFGRCTMKAV